jgi:hypothetical protein
MCLLKAKKYDGMKKHASAAVGADVADPCSNHSYAK